MHPLTKRYFIYNFNFFEAFRRIARVQRKVEQPKTFKTCGIHIYAVLKIRNCYVTGSLPRLHITAKWSFNLNPQCFGQSISVLDERIRQMIWTTR